MRQNEKHPRSVAGGRSRAEIRNPLTVMKMLYHSLDLKLRRGSAGNEARIIDEKLDR